MEPDIIASIVFALMMVVPLVYATIRCGQDIRKAAKKGQPDKIRPNEIYTLLVMPVVGYVVLLLFITMVEVLDWRYIWPVLAVNILSIGAYFGSRIHKTMVGPILLALYSIGLLAGILLFGVMLYHFSIVGLLGGIAGIAIMPPLAILVLLPYIALLQAIILFGFELVALLKHNASYYLRHKPSKNGAPEFLYWVYLGKYGVIAQLLTLPLFLLIVQFLFIWITGHHDALYLAFKESEIGMLSQGECEKCEPISTGTEYVCTVAAHGYPKLVKPRFLGIRHGTTIPVNRQLQVCNAFEELLAEQFPHLQKVLRKAYDGLQIPVDKWKHSRVVSNSLYLIIKPLEWGFLLYLYMFEPQPEKRIARQYRPMKTREMR